MRRTLTAIIGAGVVVLLYAALIYGFLVYVWPILPPWLAMACFIALAAFVIGSPIFWLLRLGPNTPVPPHLLKRRTQDQDPH